MMAWSGVAMAAMLLVAGVASSPAHVKTPARELMPPKVESDTGLATELMPPQEDKSTKEVPLTLFVINVYAVKNFTAEESNDVLHNDVIKEVPDNIAEPLAMFLLIVEDDNESEPVSLDEVAKDLMDEGFTIEKISKEGQTRLLKVDLDSAENQLEDSKEKRTQSAEASEVEESGKLMKLRRKRSVCLSCEIDSLRAKRHLHRHHGHGGGGCFGGCGDGGGFGGGGYGGGGFGGGGYGGSPYPQPVYPRPQPVYPQPVYGQPCNTCGNNGGGYGGNGGGGNAFAQASAQASASSYG